MKFGLFLVNSDFFLGIRLFLQNSDFMNEFRFLIENSGFLKNFQTFSTRILYLIFYRVGEPMSFRPYMKKDFFLIKLIVIFAKNNLTSTADNFTCTYATNKVPIYSES